MKRVLLLLFAVCFVASVLGQNAEAYRVKAEQGGASTQYQLGGYYFKGDGVVMNKYKAVMWITKAAQQGHVGAQFSLGYCYASGSGVPVNKYKAAEWYQKAAAKGYAPAQTCLGTWNELRAFAGILDD